MILMACLTSSISRNRTKARRAVRIRVLCAIALCGIDAAGTAQQPHSVRWRTLTSTRWGFQMQLPEDWRVVFVGPVHPDCSSASREIVVRPPWLARQRHEELDTIAVWFTHDPFDDVARSLGFAVQDSTWFYGSDSAQVDRGARWQSVEGQSVERVDHPAAAPGEPSFDFDMVFAAVARFDRGTGCALVFSVREVGHVSEDQSVGNVWPRVHLLTPRARAGGLRPSLGGAEPR